MLGVIVGPCLGSDEAERVRTKVEREGNGWWTATARPSTGSSAKPGEWEVVGSSSRFDS
jgi:hypothetical protein